MNVLTLEHLARQRREEAHIEARRYRLTRALRAEQRARRAELRAQRAEERAERAYLRARVAAERAALSHH